jgi:hypothetical protein
MRIDRPWERVDELDSPRRLERHDADLPATPHRTAVRVEAAAEHTEYRAKVDAVYRDHAIDRGCERVEQIEKNVVSPAMKSIEAQDPDRHLVGFDNRLKGRDRIDEKVGDAMEERGHSAQEAFGLLKDAIRYTFQYSEDHYADGVRADCDRLKAAGFEPVDRKNSWNAEEYKGINSRWRAADSGQLFEVQFHTQASFEAKQVTHSAYEKLRTHPDDENEIRQLRAYQREVSAKTPMPPGAADIPSYR